MSAQNESRSLALQGPANGLAGSFSVVLKKRVCGLRISQETKKPV